MPTLCVWNACRAPRITAFSVSCYETALGRWCTREVCIPYEPAEYPFARSVRHFVKHVSFDKDSDDLITFKLEVYGWASSQKPQQDSNFPILNPVHRGWMFEHYYKPATPTHLTGAFNQTVLRISLFFPFLLHAYASPISKFLISNRMQRRSSVKINISIWKSEVTTEWRWLPNADSLFVNFTW